MEKEQVFQRKWVKRASIIFLIVILLLTLFSKTIMNISLPQVAVQTIKGGNLKYTVMGSGTAKAAETYEVKLDQVRVVANVLVKKGQIVKNGDVLFTLQEAKGDEMKVAEDLLDELELQYEKATQGQSDADILTQNTAVDRAKEDLVARQNDQKVLIQSISELKTSLTNANSERKDQIETEIKQKEQELDGIKKEVLTLQRQLEDSKLALSNAQKAKSLLSLDIKALKNKVDDQKENVEKIRKAFEQKEVTAGTDGIIENINVTPGVEIVPGSILATIDTGNKGYQVEILVNKEMTEQFEIGASARTNNYAINAELTSIEVPLLPDLPDSPEASNGGQESEDQRILTFTLTGEVVPGEQYSLTMENEGKLYEYLIPLSALRTDSSGYFILGMESEETPFGQRYKAKRVSVKVLEKNSQQVAIKGNFGNISEVITYSSVPIESGDQVKVGENEK